MIWIAIVLYMLGTACTKDAPKHPPVAASKPMPRSESVAMNKTTPAPTPNADGALFVPVQLTARQQKQMQEINLKEKKFAPLKGKDSRGKSVFLANCSRCHGIEGRGDGPESPRLPIAPTNFHQWPIKFGTSLADIVFTISYGRSEGDMPPFKKTLKEEDIWLVAHYIKPWIDLKR